MDTLHRPVMLEEVLGLIVPRPDRVILDLTLGGGGYTAAFLERGARVHGLDRDPQAVQRCTARLARFAGRFDAHHGDFATFGDLLDDLGTTRVDAICMDLGLSSDQLDDPARGFAFRLDGPLDLRFDPRSGVPAWQRLEAVDEATLADWLRQWGEVRRPRRLARLLCGHARAGRLRTTLAARDVIQSTLPAGVRPEPELARVFQALRIAVNDEMHQLESALAQVPARLREGGRFVAVSYHSLEDRRVKSMLRRESGHGEGSRHVPAGSPTPVRMRVLTRRPLRPSAPEVQANPRARSARLRAGERLP
jgi:16S rRNA (cytosine1402-N4)-methyltransferase